MQDSAALRVNRKPGMIVFRLQVGSQKVLFNCQTTFKDLIRPSK